MNISSISGSADFDERLSPEVSVQRDSSPLGPFHPASLQKNAPRTIYVQPSLESRDESVNLMDDDYQDLFMARY